MANYFYTDADGQQQGPNNWEQLKELAQNGTITPITQLEKDRKYLGPAGQFPKLFVQPVQKTPMPILRPPHEQEATPPTEIALPTVFRENPTAVVIAIVSIVAFFLMFVPVPWQCGLCEGKGVYKILYSTEKCAGCNGSGIAYRTVWSRLNN
jgi:hypothetical protein